MPLLDLDGQSFIGVYMLLLFGATAAAYAIHAALRSASADQEGTSPDFSAAEVAYLAGGADASVATELSSLFSRSLVRYDTISLRVTADGAAGPDMGEFETAVHGALARRSTTPIALRDRLKTELDAIAARLSDAGLLTTSGQHIRIRFTCVAPMLIVLLLGVAKMVLGISRGRPIMFLALLMMLGLFAVMFIVAAVSRRTRAGDAVLAALRQQHAALESTARSRSNALKPQELGLAVGLFGVTVLQGTALAGLGLMLKPATAAGSSSCSSSSSSSCSSSGGGCGGCSD